MQRREFLKYTSAGVALTVVAPEILVGAIGRSGDADPRAIALAAIDAARAAGASYADARVASVRTQLVSAREQRVQEVNASETFGFGVRVLVDGCWGFAASNVMTLDEVARVARLAVAQARANRATRVRPVELAPVQAFPDAKWRSPIEIDPFDVPIEEKVELLFRANEAAMKVPGARFANSSMFFHTEHVILATTEGSVIEQTLYRTLPSLSVTAVAPDRSGFATRNSSEVPALQAGYEYIHEVDFVATAPKLAEDAVAILSARPVQPGTYDLVLHPSNLFLTIHESIGHTTELDRAMGYEANYAGTSFLAPPEKVLGKFRFGPEFMQVRADRTQPRALATTGWDHEGVPAQEWDIIKDGIFVNYQTTREQASWIADLTGIHHSLGCSYAQSWADVPFQRMPNVNLLPGKEDLSIDDIIADTEDGIYIMGRGSYSIDQQRYNFQFGGQVFYEIKKGKITGMLKDVAYQSRTPDFWNALDALGGPRTYHLGGTPSDGKGQPGQSNAVTHGCPVARFRKIPVINTGRAAV
jgi:TldD protein